jgi:hypothetical protein
MKEFDVLQEKLNHSDKETRLEALEKIKVYTKNCEKGKDVNNHIHTIYSFSPYSPSKAVYMAYTSGLGTAGIMDHDSIAGASEFIDAGRIMGMKTTIGVECRVSMKDTFLSDIRINNPDQKGVAYCAIHGIPHTRIKEIERYFKPYIEQRMKRNAKMIDNINELMGKYDIAVDLKKDIIPISMYHDGGTVTERHILFALAKKMILRFGKGAALVRFLKEDMGSYISKKAMGYLMDENNEIYPYDLLGVLKTDLISRIYVDAVQECPDVKDLISLARCTGAISAYAYLGDVGDSVTGDKKAQHFEDTYIEELFELLVELGFNAVTYMPSRNTKEQLTRVRQLCEKHALFQISGEDINQPRQSFVCQAMKRPEFKNLIDSTYALIGHEMEATADIERGMFSKEVMKRMPALETRIQYFKSKVSNG